MQEETIATSEVAALRAALAESRTLLAEALTDKDRIQAELILRDRAINAATSGIMILDAQTPGWPIVFANDAVVRRTGYAQNELAQQGRFLRDIADRDQAEALKQAMECGEDLRTELQQRRKDGSLYWAGLFVGPVRDAARRLTHYIVLSADITARVEADRKRAELQAQLERETREREALEMELKLSQKLESVGRLAAGIAHEINTPVQYVSDSAHFLRTAVNDLESLLGVYRRHLHALAGAGGNEVLAEVQAAEAAADLEFVHQEIPRSFDRMLEGLGRVTRIVGAMKEFAHPDAGEQNPADINHALETTLLVAHNEYKYVATVHTELGNLPAVKCNISELNQVFLNLIVNAAHAITSAGRDMGSGSIVLRTLPLEGQVEISIEDNGCGIPAEHLDKIYDPFFTTKEVGKGTGQGLAIARSIVVERHGGTLDVQSTVGSGTRFSIRLPVEGRTLEVTG